MKIIIVGALKVAGSDIPFLLRRALEKQGHQVLFCAPKEELTPWETALQRSGRQESRAFLRSFSRRLVRMARAERPELILVYGSNWSIQPETIDEIRQKLGTVVVLWEGNFRFWRGFQVESLRRYDHLFVLDSYLEPLFRDTALLPSVHPLPAVCDPAIHRPMRLGADELAELGGDVAYLGTGFPKRIAVFEQLTDFELRLWGGGWDRSPALARFYRDESVYGLKKSKIYNASRINLNIQNPISQVNGISCRCFEILSCGGFCLTEYKPDLERYFRLGEEIVAFDGIADLRAKIAYYLANEGERLEVAARGRSTVVRRYTYDHIVREMLEISMQGRGVATTVVAPRPETTGANGGPPLVSTGTG
jgi:spore maturation protein CgeB